MSDEPIKKLFPPPVLHVVFAQAMHGDDRSWGDVGSYSSKALADARVRELLTSFNCKIIKYLAAK